MVGIGVCRRWVCVCMAYGVQACVGTVYGVCVCGYGVQALGVRMVYVVYVSCGVRCVYVCMSIH